MNIVKVIIIFSSILFLSCKDSVVNPSEKVKIISKDSYNVCVKNSITLNVTLSDSSTGKLKWEMLSGVGKIYSNGYFQAPNEITADSVITKIRVSLEDNLNIYCDIKVIVFSNPYNTFEIIKDYRGEPTGTIELQTGEYLTYGSMENKDIFQFTLWKHDANGNKIDRRFIPINNSNIHMGGKSAGIYESPTNEIWLYSFKLSEENYPAYLAKIDNNLNVVVDKTFQDKRIKCIRISDDGNIFLGGVSSTYGWIAKLNKNLEVQWSKTIKEYNSSEIISFTLDDNNIAFIGNIYGPPFGYFFGRVNNDGSNFHFSNKKSGEVSSMIKKNNHFLIQGRFPHLAAREIDENGDNIWTNEFFNGGNWFSRNIYKTKDNNYILSGWTSSDISNGNFDGYLIKIDENGLPIWIRNYGGTYYDYCYQAIETSDGGFFLSGQINGKLALIKTDNLGKIKCPCSCY